MKTKTSAQLILELLLPVMSSAGFKYRKSENDYIRRTNLGFESMGLIGFSPSRGVAETGLPQYECDAYLSVRHDEIQDRLIPLKLNYFDPLDRTRPSAFRTVTGRFHPFDRERDKVLEISHANMEADVFNAAQQIEAMLESAGFAWFSTFSEVSALDDALNTSAECKPHPICNNLENRIYQGIATAACLDREYGREISQRYLSILRQDQSIAEDLKPPIERKASLIMI